MRVKQFFSPLGALLAVVMIAACQDTPSTAPPPEAVVPVAALTLAPTVLQLEPDSTRLIVASLSDASGRSLAGREIIWQTSAPAVAQVTANGLVTAIAPGSATITAASGGRTTTAQVNVLERGASQSVNVIDSTQLRLASDSAQHAAGTFEFIILDSTALLPVSTGQVLLGTERGGFLRRVSSVQRTGDRILVQTTDAALSDVVRDGMLNISVPLTLTDSATSLGQPTSDLVFTGAAQVSSALPALSVANGAIQIGAVNLIADAGGTSLQFTDGVVRFDPTVKLNAHFSLGRVQSLEASVAGAVTFDGRLAFATTGAFQRNTSLELFRVSRPFVAYVAGLPVIGTMSLVFRATGQLEAQAAFSGTKAFTSTTSLRVGAQYARAASPSWSNTSGATAQFGSSLPLTVQQSVQGAVQAGLDATIEITVFRSATGGLGTAAQARAQRVVDLGRSRRTDTCTGSIGASITLRAQILGLTLAEYQRDTTLAERVFCRVEAPLRRTTTLTGRVYNGVTNAPVSNATVSVREGLSLVATTVTNALGVYTISVPDTVTYRLDVAAPGFTDATIRAQLVRGPTTAVALPLVPFSTATGRISGRVLNASTNGAIAGAEVELRSGVNATEGTPIATARSTATGSYSFGSLPAGTYSVRASSTGFVSGVRIGISVGGTTVNNQDVVLSSVGSNAVVRVVLTWGASPSDLDSHLTGPIPGSNARFHVYWARRGSCLFSPFACLDVDDVTAFGPETITITQLFDGVYRYSVQNFSAAGGGGSLLSSGLATSNARVDVYVNNQLRESFAVPQQPGTLWTVFSMDRNANITPINTITGVAPPGIRAPSGSTGEAADTDDAAVIHGTNTIKKSPPKPALR